MSHLNPTSSFTLRVAGLALAIGVALTYGLGWIDLLRNGQVERDAASVAAAIPESVGYWLTSVLPYWWFLIVCFVTSLTVLALGLRWIWQRFGASSVGAA